MNLWLYSHLVDSPGNRLILEEGDRRGHQVTLKRPSAAHLALHLPLPEEMPDLLLTRTGGSAPAAAIDYLRTLAFLGVPCLNTPMGLYRTRHKGVAYALLASHGVPIPKTVTLGNAPLEEAIACIPGPPWILKLPLSTKGQGVSLVESMRSLRSTADVLRETSQTVLLQEFIATAKGADIRVMVLGGKAVLAARRSAAGGDEFRSNLHLGGGATRVELSEEIASIAERASEALGLEMAGVDLLEGPDGYLVVEVNSSPGLTASPKLPSLLFDFLESRVAP